MDLDLSESRKAEVECVSDLSHIMHLGKIVLAAWTAVFTPAATVQ